MTSTVPDLRDRCLGGLLGCAVGDALGAPYEGLWSHQIPPPAALLAGFAEVEGYPLGQYTDDTQLTAATLRSIVRCGEVLPSDIARAIAALWRTESVVGPGGACTSAAWRFLETGDWTTCGAAVGQAGNGTAMRTALLGLYFLNDPDRLPAAVADVSRITHQDPRSVAGGVAVAKAAQLLAAAGPSDDPTLFCAEVARVMKPYEVAFADLVAGLPPWLGEPRETALAAIAWSGMSRPEFSVPVITPFVVPTVLASLWCLLRHPDSWPEAVAEAVGLGGDVDTLGAIVGALAGVRLGFGAIPSHLREGVFQAGRLERLALRYHTVLANRSHV
jgi:ADP-ribosyl-[dinitrogen reductase] hydrolase